MTDIINFFQFMFLFNNFESAKFSKQEIELAVDLNKAVQNLEDVAEEEVKNGHVAQELAAEATDENKIRIFTEIAVW